MKCVFCLAGSRTTKISKEHLFSKPICSALGIDRTKMIASLDGNTGEVSRPLRLDQRLVKLPCVDCNSGWMEQLERDTARTLRRWLSEPSSRLTTSGYAHVVRWTAKTAIVFGFAELGSRQFLANQTDAAVPDITIARQLANGEVPDILIGGARASRTDQAWGAGNASVEPVGPDRISSRAVNVLALTLGELQLWGVLPVIQPDDVHLPPGVQRLLPNSKSRSLRGRQGGLDPSQVTAFFSDATTEAFMSAFSPDGL